MLVKGGMDHRVFRLGNWGSTTLRLRSGQALSRDKRIRQVHHEREGHEFTRAESSRDDKRADPAQPAPARTCSWQLRLWARQSTLHIFGTAKSRALPGHRESRAESANLEPCPCGSCSPPRADISSRS